MAIVREYNNIQKLITFCAIVLAMVGAIIPGMFPAVFVIPMSKPANLGAISMWLTICPALPMPPPIPVPITMKVTDSNCVLPK